MTEVETAKIIAILKEYYPRDIESTNVKSKVRAWHMILAGYDYMEVQAAVIAYAASDTKGFPPVPGQILDKLTELKSGGEMLEAEAWNLVCRATANGFYGSQAEFEKLPPMLQKIVGSPYQLREWAMIDSSTFNTVIQSNFLKSYRTMMERKRDEMVLPDNVKALFAPKNPLLGDENGA